MRGEGAASNWRRGCIAAVSMARTINRADVLGEVVRGRMVPNGIGEIVADCWLWLERHFGHVVLDEWTLMPTHMHGILVLSAPLHRGERQLRACARE